jgi:acyl-coenzyme A synthetase/AMP-(fatty) acid ligase
MHDLWSSIAAGGQPPAGALHGPQGSVSLGALGTHTVLEGRDRLRDRSVLLATKSQLASALALIELDGLARRIVLATPDLDPAQLDIIARKASADAVILEEDQSSSTGLEVLRLAAKPERSPVRTPGTIPSEWILLTSGTTGAPKLVVHSLQSLRGPLPHTPPSDKRVWATFYDIRRYGGLQIYLRAVLGGAELVLSSAGESATEFLTRAARAGVTHISGTPSHWRRALMSGDARLIAPRYVRLSGEVADQTILDNLRATYPEAQLAHAFASTEAGVGFEVNDGLAGFPAEMLDARQGEVELKVREGTLHLRSRRLASRYIDEAGITAPVGDDEGFVDTGDLVEQQADRYYFRGRRGGIINVGGLKVYPEEVEAIINTDPRVRMSLVKARRNPIVGAVVVADVVLIADASDESAVDRVKQELLDLCRQRLATHKIPALLRFVPHLDITPAGKLVRPDA